MRIRTRATVAISTIALSVMSACAMPAPPLTYESTSTSCTEKSVPVRLAANDLATHRIAGWLSPGRPDKRREGTVLLLVSGLTFSHTYWSATYQPDRYSYVQAANRRGYTTFSIDRIGVGNSDHPPAESLTLQTHAYTVMQVIRQLRTGTIGGKTFTTVVGVGHSLGAGILQYEAGTVTQPKATPDYLVLTGYLSRTVPTAVAGIGGVLYPADDDPAFAARTLPRGYLTTRPGTRTMFFEPGTDPQVLPADEQSKETTSLAERATVSAARDPAVTRAIHAPVMLMVGQADPLGCAANDPQLSCADAAAIKAREAANFSAAACLTAAVIADAGHAINLQPGAPSAYAKANDWIDRYVLAPEGSPKANGCRGA